MKKKILIAVDGSDQSLDAVRYAGDFFPPEKTEIVIFHVFTEVPEAFLDLKKDPAYRTTVLPIGSWVTHHKEKMNNFARHACDILTGNGFPKESVSVKIEGKKVGVARDILSESGKGYAAVVVGRSGVSRLKDIVIGTIAHKLIGRLSDIPLVVVGGSPETEKILIAFDGSAGSQKGVDCACSLMAGMEREVLLCHVVRGLNLFLENETVFSPDQENEWVSMQKKEIDVLFDKAERQLIESAFYPANVFREVIEDASRAAGIKRAAETGGFGTIVVGRRGFTDVREFLLGRVSRKILHMANTMAVWIV